MVMSVPPSSGNSTVVSTTMRPVGILLVETTAMVRPDSALSRLTGSGGREEIKDERGGGAARRDFVGDLDGPGIDAEVGDHRSALLGEAGLIEATHVAPVEHGRRTEDLVDGDYARASNAHHVERE